MSQTAKPARTEIRLISPDWRRRVIQVLIAVAIIPILIPIVVIGYVNWVPPYTATMVIPELRAQLTLRFYYVWDEGAEHGRYLTIRGPAGNTTIAMTAYDWAHNSRTSIYRTPDGEIARPNGR
jgi:hypothetical protein